MFVVAEKKHVPLLEKNVGESFSAMAEAGDGKNGNGEAFARVHDGRRNFPRSRERYRQGCLRPLHRVSVRGLLPSRPLIASYALLIRMFGLSLGGFSFSVKIKVYTVKLIYEVLMMFVLCLYCTWY